MNRRVATFGGTYAVRASSRRGIQVAHERPPSGRPVSGVSPVVPRTSVWASLPGVPRQGGVAGTYGFRNWRAPKAPQAPSGAKPAGLGAWWEETWNYWTRGTPAYSTAPARATPSGPGTGAYAEGGYAYWYDAATGAITITVSPKGGGPRAVAKGSAAYTAILAQIRSGKARRVSDDEIRALRARATTPAASSTSRSASAERTVEFSVAPDAPSSATSAPGASGSWLDAVPSWAPWAVGGVAAAGALLLILTPPRASRAA